MRILVLNGSPKGENSITLQTSKYLEKIHSEHEFIYLNVGQKYRLYEKDFEEPAKELMKADLIVFSYPVYTFIVPAQLHRFVELMKESGLDFSSKIFTQISTSKHFYDITAHEFIRENGLDMGMRYIRGLSADMDDLLTDKGQKDARDFFDFVAWNVAKLAVSEVLTIDNNHSENTVSDMSDKNDRIVIVTDLKSEDNKLKFLIDEFCRVMPYQTDIVNIAEFPFKGGCISCFNCATDGKCIYDDKFDEYLRNNIQTASAIVIAFSIKDHSMGYTFKLYDDRQFCNGHRTVTMGMPFGYLVSGELSKEANLRTIINARAEVGGNYLAGIASDEFGGDAGTTASVENMAAVLKYSIDNKYVQPSNFYGVGGMKIFRDLIYLMQGMMKADHKFYKSHGQYDFPQKKKGTLIKMYLVGALISNSKIKKKMGNKMNEGMMLPYKKLFEKM